MTGLVSEWMYEAMGLADLWRQGAVSWLGEWWALGWEPFYPAFYLLCDDLGTRSGLLPIYLPLTPIGGKVQ